MRKTEEKVKSSPILMNTEMVRAILSGQKIQTRRPVKPQPNADGLSKMINGPWQDDNGRDYRCPFGTVGDRLWVREAWSCISSWVRPGACLAYRADTPDGEKVRCDAPWRPSIHMPRWASRITLEITGVHVEQICNISNGSILREGVRSESCNVCHLVGGSGCEHCSVLWKAFSGLWDSIYAKRGLGWSENPWVWVIEFRRVDS